MQAAIPDIIEDQLVLEPDTEHVFQQPCQILPR